MNQLEAMQIFVRVAELASFTQAASSMGLPKASVSNAVQQLEARLGTRLLHRTTRKVQVTQDGQVFYERSKDLLADVNEMQTLFRPDGRGLRGRLRVNMPLASRAKLSCRSYPNSFSNIRIWRSNCRAPIDGSIWCARVSIACCVSANSSIRA